MRRRLFMELSAAGGAGTVLTAMGLPARARELLLKDLQELDTLEYFERNAAGEQFG